MPDRHPHILRPDTSLLLVIDMQDSFLQVMHGRDTLVANIRLLIETAKTLAIPILTTLQYAQRLGGLAPEIADILPAHAPVPLDKMTFSCAGSEAFIGALEDAKRSQILICGVETHICVAQTALDIAHLGYQVHVAADGASSRTLEKHKLGMERIRDSAVLPCATEAAVYEWLEAAGTPAFRHILPLVK